ncbi:MAG: CoA-acylating methylmalonate-semialdehyde dehydrogenase [Chloroflexota bacterium]|nr:CoA-acylating methylmalonate-semialdehyde dehydrogenase [Chloroflexota bacterium]
MTATIGATREIPASAHRGDLKNFIGGEWVAAQTSEYLDVPNPASEELLARVPLSTAADVDAAVKAARRAFEDWSELAVPERANYMFLFREALNDYREELTRLCTTENGKVYSDSAGEVRRGIEVVDFACGMPTLMMGTNLDQVSKGIDSELVRFPVGVCAGITPFNFPFMVPLWMYPLALAAGNTFILKPSERTPLTSVRTIEILAEIGLPPGVINIVHGGAEAVTALCSNPGVDAVSFVGSARVARVVYETAAKHGKRVQALGGAKNHIIVMPDAVIEPSIANITESAFGNAGQRCLAGSVMTVVGKARDEFLPRFVENADHLRMGFGLDEGVDLGPVIRDESRQRILGYVERGVAGGARILRDGRSGTPSKGYFLGPTILEIDPEAEMARDELFGPVLSVLKADSVETALDLMRTTNEYGNAGSIFTSSGKAAREFKRRSSAGMLGVNIGVAAPMAFFPFSGRRNSFFGDLHVTGRDGVEFYTTKKVVTTRWF